MQSKPRKVIPTPPRPLGNEGTRIWERVWTLDKAWLDPTVDLDWVTLLAESVDERVMLRFQTLQNGDWRDRVALRALDALITDLLTQLGMNPVQRAQLAPHDAQPGKLAALREARAQPRGA